MQSLKNFVAADLADHLAKAGYQSSHQDERMTFISIHPQLVIPVNVVKLDKLFQQDSNYVPDLSQAAGYASYLKKVGIGGLDWHMKKYNPLKEALPEITALQCPRISFYNRKAGFLDGITRFTLLRDAGFRTILVQVPREDDVAEYTEALGGEVTTTAPLSFDLMEEWHDALHCALALMPYGTQLDGYTKVVNPEYIVYILRTDEIESLKPDFFANERAWIKGDEDYSSREILQNIGGARLLHLAYYTLKKHLSRL